MKSYLYNHRSAPLQTPSAERTQCPLPWPFRAVKAQTGLFLKRLVEEPAFRRCATGQFGLELPTTSGPRAPRNASVRLRLHKNHLPR